MSTKKPLITKVNDTTLKYKNKHWKIEELLAFLADKVEELNKLKCKPCIKCVFKIDEFYEKKFGLKKELPTSFY